MENEIIIDLEPLEAQSDKKNTWIVFNQIKGFLWGLRVKGEAFINEDRTRLIYGNVDSEIKKASIWEIVILKYVSALLLAYFIVYDVNSYYPSMVAVGMSILIFYFFKKYKERWNRTLFYGGMLTISFSFIYFILKSGDAWNISGIMNYIFQYFIAIYIMNEVYEDVLSKGFDGYYEIKNKPFKFIKIYDNKDEIDESISFSEKTKNKIRRYVKLLSFGVVFVSFLIAGVQILHEIVAKNNLEKFEKQFGFTRDNIDVNSQKWLKYLDKRADELGIERLHRINNEKYYHFKNIENYTELTLNGNTMIACVQSWEESQIDSVYRHYGAIFGHKLQKEKTNKVISFIRNDGNFYFIDGDLKSGKFSIYQIKETKE